MAMAMDQELVRFGSRFREQREAKALSLREMARVTKIPERSLERLEAGQFDELPAEVFVRGFVRSYARELGLDAEEMTRRYGELVRGSGGKRVAAGTAPPPAAEGVASKATSPSPSPTASTTTSTSTTTSATTSTLTSEEAPKKKGVSILDTDEFKSLSRAILDAGKETRRMPLTLAVIILVIVATLTMSLLLNRPSRTGDGLSRADAQSRVG